MKVHIRKIDSWLTLGMFLMILKVSLDLSDIVPYPEILDTILVMAAVASFGIVIIEKTYTVSQVIICGGIILLALSSVLITKNSSLLITVITCFALKDEDFDDIVQFLFCWESLFWVLHTISAFILNPFTGNAISQNIFGVLRYDFGFKHPNHFSIYLFNLMLLWVWIYFEQIKEIHILIMIVLAAGSYIFTKTRTNFIEMLLLVVILQSILLWKQKICLVYSRIAKISVPFCFCISLGSMMYYKSGNAVIQILDQIFSARIRMGAFAYEKWGITLLGTNIKSFHMTWDPYWRLNEHTFDNIYSMYAMNQGLIWIILIAVLFYKLAALKNVKINCSILFWSLYGLTEVHGQIGYLCFPIFLTSILFSEKTCQKYT